MQPCLEGLEDAPPRAAEGALEPPGQRASGQQQPRDPGNTAATVIGDDTSHWLLTSLRLLAVQPACLPRLADPAAAVQHSLLLHLEAGLECRPAGHSSGAAQPAAAGSEPEAGAVVMAAGSVLDPPLQLSSAELEVVVLAHNMQLLLQRQARLGQLVQQQQQQQQEQGTSTSADATSGGRSVCINISISFPAQPSQSSMDAVHLLLTAHERPSAAAGTGSSSSGSSSSRRLAVLVAEVPILLMSAAAQQEVQQLLLPAMRQDVQAGLAEQQQQQQQQQPTDERLSQQMMAVESGAWQHFYQLSRDIYTIVQLSDAAAAAAAAAESGEPGQGITVLQLSAAGSVPPPALALQHLSENLVLPLLLPFLAAHGLYNLLQQLLGCLPLPLQQRWQQQQNERLVSLCEQSLLVQQNAGVSSQLASTAEGRSAAKAAAGEDRGSPHAACHSGVAASAPASGQQRAGTGQLCAGAAGACSCSSHKPSAAKACSDAAAAGPVPAGGADGGASWPVPLSGFADPLEEQRYVAWKHASLLHLDWLSAAFDAVYLLVLVKRMLREPTTIFYLLFIVLKTLPHLPLVLGYHRAFLRHRELWLFLIGPATALLTWLAAVTSVYVLKQPPLLLTASAFKAFWQGRGELATSTMRPFMQHMRLEPYAAYVALDAVTSTFIFAQTYGFAAAASRWAPAAVWSVALCWALDLHMRRLFLAQQGRQAAQLAARDSPVSGGGIAASGVAVKSKQKQA